MKRKSPQRGGVIPALAVCFFAGIVVGWWLKSGAPLPAVSDTARPEEVATTSSRTPGPAARPGAEGDVTVDRREAEAGRARDATATTGEPLLGPEPPSAASVMSDLRRRNLRLPIDDADVDLMEGGFAERRGGDSRGHEAVDILAPRNTPVHAVDDGTIAKLFVSKAGGITLYQFDPAGRFCYYYAHLERYADGLREGQRVSRGDVIGYVGTTGNAPPNTPHLHLAVFELDAERRWWKGRAIDPYFVFRR